MTERRPVLVTTAHRGVFFGYANGYSAGDPVIHLTRARNILYWPTDTRGFIGLSTFGPQKGSRVGPPAESIELRDITSVAVCSAEATEAWEHEPWSR